MSTTPGKSQELELLDHIRKRLSASQTARTHFEKDLRWLDLREQNWLHRPFQIGLIGITSSGKSTLVNALLGEKLLPEKVRPSSNTLVVCEQGATLEAVVDFKDKRKQAEVLVGEEKIADRLKRYGDEASNPKNQEGVEEIRIRSPRFKLDAGTVLIDTPGLDAHEHADHERLTLDLLLPTVDAVLFLTTCKSNSDQKISEYVRRAQEAGKQVMVVQNMTDSVVPKLGSRGVVFQDRTQVLEGHRQRFQKLLKPSTALVQCSAKWALDPSHTKNSGLNQLIQGIRALRDTLAPRVSIERMEQLRRRVADICRQENANEDPAQRKQRLDRELTTLQKQAHQLETRYAHEEMTLRAADEEAQAKAAPFAMAAQTLNARSVHAAYALRHDIDAWLRASPAHLEELDSRLMSQVKNDAQDLNLRIEDLTLNTRLRRHDSTLNLQTVQRQIIVRTEQSGIFGWLKRKVDLGDNSWGYDESIEHRTEITDLDAFKASVQSTVSKELGQVEQFVHTWIQRLQSLSVQFLDEIDLRIADRRRKQTSAVNDIERRQIVQQLERLVLMPSETPAPMQTPTPCVSTPLRQEDWIDHEVPVRVVNLVQLAQLISRRRFLEARDQHLPSDCERVLIAGFNSDRLQDFVNRFWFDRLESQESHADFSTVHLHDDPVREIARACIPDTDDTHNQHQIEKFLRTPCVVFLMLDIQQIGATASQLARRLPKLQPEHHLILVVESIQELEHANTTTEALQELHHLAKRQNWRPTGVLVNDENTSFSAVAHWLLIAEGAAAQRTKAQETAFLKKLAPRDQARAGELIRSLSVPDLSTH